MSTVLVLPNALTGNLPFPGEYFEKCNRALIASSGTTSAFHYGLICFRLDGDEIDQDPVIVVVQSGTGKAFQLLHADHPSRTTTQTPEFRQGLMASGITTEVPIPELPKKDYGPIGELAGVERAGFDHGVQRILTIVAVKKD